MKEPGLVSGAFDITKSILTVFLPKYQVDLDSSSRLKSVTQEKDLDEFLSTAQLAGTEFTAGWYHSL